MGLHSVVASNMMLPLGGCRGGDTIGISTRAIETMSRVITTPKCDNMRSSGEEAADYAAGGAAAIEPEPWHNTYSTSCSQAKAAATSSRVWTNVRGETNRCTSTTAT